MTKFCTNRNKQTILIESIPYSNWEIEMVRMNIPADNRSFRQELFSFLSEWFDPADTLPVHTSGSTGKPKELYVEKERMMESACLINPEKPDVPLNKNDAFQKVQKRHVQEKR